MPPRPHQDVRYPWSRRGLAARSRVAQLAEQPAVNRQVIGSSPIAGATLTALVAAGTHSHGPGGASGQGIGDDTGVGMARDRGRRRLLERWNSLGFRFFGPAQVGPYDAAPGARSRSSL